MLKLLKRPEVLGVILILTGACMWTGGCIWYVIQQREILWLAIPFSLLIAHFVLVRRVAILQYRPEMTSRQRLVLSLYAGMQWAALFYVFMLGLYWSQYFALICAIAGFLPDFDDPVRAFPEQLRRFLAIADDRTLSRIGPGESLRPDAQNWRQAIIESRQGPIAGGSFGLFYYFYISYIMPRKRGTA